MLSRLKEMHEYVFNNRYSTAIDPKLTLTAINAPSPAPFLPQMEYAGVFPPQFQQPNYSTQLPPQFQPFVSAYAPTPFLPPLAQSPFDSFPFTPSPLAPSSYTPSPLAPSPLDRPLFHMDVKKERKESECSEDNPLVDSMFQHVQGMDQDSQNGPTSQHNRPTIQVRRYQKKTEAEKNDDYHQKRIKNNESVRRCREQQKMRAAQQEAEKKMFAEKIRWLEKMVKDTQQARRADRQLARNQLREHGIPIPEEFKFDPSIDGYN